MFSLRNILTAGSVFLLTTAHAHAVQINLSSDNIDQYFRILEVYVLPLMVVSTVVLFCGYLASRIFHRTVSRKQDGTVGRDAPTRGPDDDTAAFLRELKTTPPIVEPEEPQLSPEPKPEPKVRAPHPLLRRRGSAKNADSPVKPQTAPQPVAAPKGAERPAPSVAPAAARPEGPRPVASGTEPASAENSGGSAGGRSQIPRLQAAFRRDEAVPENSDNSQEAASGDSRNAAVEPPIVAPAEEPIAPAEPVLEEPRLRPVPKAEPEEPRAESVSELKPAREQVAPEPIPSAEPADASRREPTISVVQALNPGRPVVPPVDNEAVRAKATEIVDSLDHIASVLQQSSVTLAERIKNKKGLLLEDVKALRVTGFDQPGNVLEDMHRLGGDAGEEVLAAYAAVAAFNNVVRRLEQMADKEPLDEGWNELVRSRIAETIFAVGQVRKTLAIYRRAAKKPANSEKKQGTAGKTPKGGAGGSLPVGRRQV